jgi:hypothetical protein
MSYAYQWKRNGANISGATDNDYTLVMADFGATITATVTANNAAGSTSATSDPTATVTKTTLNYTPVTSATNGVLYTGATPSTTGGTAPYVYSNTGTLPAGTTLNTSTGVISGTPTTNAAYSGIVLRVTDANGIAAASASFTITVSAAAGTIPGNSGGANLPSIAGTAVAGRTLTASPGTWTGSPTPTFTYQWKRAGANISGATNTTYVAQIADAGSTLTVTVTGTNTAGNSSATSSATATVTKTTLSYTPVTSATNGTPYTGATPTTTGGTTPYVYSNTGTLPAGTTLNTSTGVISGTPTTTATYSGIVLTATDANGIAHASSSFTITVAPAASLPAPVLVWTSANTVYDPVFTATFTAAVADVLTLEIDDNSDFSSLFDSDVNTLDSAEVAAGTVTYSGITTLSPGVTYYARLKLQRGASSVYSNTVNQTMFIDTASGLTFTPTDVTQAWKNSASSPITFSANIGTAATDRIVVVAVYLESSGTATTGVTANGVALTPIVSYSMSASMQQSIYASAPGAVSGSGVQNVVVTTVNAFPSAIEIMVGTITGSAAATAGPTASVPCAASPDPHVITATVPANGVAVIAMQVDRAFTPVITGATGAGNVRNTASNLTTAAIGYGNTNTVSFTGANGFELGILMATWGP